MSRGSGRHRFVSSGSADPLLSDPSTATPSVSDLPAATSLRAPRTRLTLGAVLAAVAIVLGTFAVPVHSTLASFTDSETAGAGPSITAGTLGTASVVGCQVNTSRVQVTWATAPGSIPPESYLIRFTDLTNGTVIDFTAAASEQTTQIQADAAAGFTGNRDYRVAVFSQISSAPRWTSTAGSTARFYKGPGNGNNSCT